MDNKQEEYRRAKIGKVFELAESYGWNWGYPACALLVNRSVDIGCVLAGIKYAKRGEVDKPFSYVRSLATAKHNFSDDFLAEAKRLREQFDDDFMSAHGGSADVDKLMEGWK